MSERFTVKGTYDLHVHCGPEPIPRRYTFGQLDCALRSSGMAGAVAKSHCHSTAPWTAALGEDGVLFGSVTLNYHVGGINPDAVRGSLGLGAERALRIVWMPTIHAAGHVRMQRAHGQEYDIPAEWTGGALSPGSRPLDSIKPISIFDPPVRAALEEVLDIIRDNGLALATGHLTREEVLDLVPLAKQKGVRSVILTHPLYHATSLTDDDLASLTAFDGVYAEQSYGLMLIDRFPLSDIVRQIRRVGPEKTILTSDLGQGQTPPPAEGMQTFFDLLAAEGFTNAELQRMALDNPKKILGIE